MSATTSDGYVSNGAAQTSTRRTFKKIGSVWLVGLSLCCVGATVGSIVLAQATSTKTSSGGVESLSWSCSTNSSWRSRPGGVLVFAT